MTVDGRYVHLNGRLVAASKARISALDRGLLYGDGLFETVRAYRGQPFALEEHAARLSNSLHMLGIILPPIDWGERIRSLLRRNRLLQTDCHVRLTGSRRGADSSSSCSARHVAASSCTRCSVRMKCTASRRSSAASM
jgi:branched-subunit amino acid aminotransferase/4-amino-4-deoxychorismate lyase